MEASKRVGVATFGFSISFHRMGLFWRGGGERG